MTQINIKQKLLFIQSELKAPKGQRNSFGKYNYRSAEDILEALKPIMLEQSVTLVCTDRIEMRGTFMFNVTTAQLLDCESEDAISAEHWAMHSESKKGMDSAQISGSTASYSLKRALGNLFAIDNEKDADAINTHGKAERPKEAAMPAQQAIEAIDKCNSMEELATLWKKIPSSTAKMNNVIEAKNNQKIKLS
jgi:hypothetical protein